MPDPISGVNPSDPVGSAPVAGHTGSAPGAAPRPDAAIPAQDSADVGQTEALLAAIGKAAASVPEIDQARVAELQKTIADGAYQVNPRQIAQNLLGLDRALAREGN